MKGVMNIQDTYNELSLQPNVHFPESNDPLNVGAGLPAPTILLVQV